MMLNIIMDVSFGMHVYLWSITMSLNFNLNIMFVYVDLSIYACLTHWDQVTHICVGNLTIIGSDNGLLSGRRQAITWTNIGILLIGPLGTNFSEMLIEIHTFSLKKSIWKYGLENGGHFVSASMC